MLTETLKQGYRVLCSLSKQTWAPGQRVSRSQSGKMFGGMPTSIKGIQILFHQIELGWVLCDETSEERKQTVRASTEEKGKEKACLGIGRWSEQDIKRLSPIGHVFGHKVWIMPSMLLGKKEWSRAGKKVAFGQSSTFNLPQMVSCHGQRQEAKETLVKICGEDTNLAVSFAKNRHLVKITLTDVKMKCCLLWILQRLK